MPKEKSAGAVVFRKEPKNSRRKRIKLIGKQVVFRQERDSKIYYLLLHYKSGHWDFPKGHIEEGETEEKAVKREIEEETGIKDIKIIKGFRETIKYFFRRTYGLEKKKEKKKRAPWVFKIVVFYLAETKTKKVKISFEHTGYKWLPYKEALKQLTYKKAKEILKKANNQLIPR